jgi:hypothetical protein
MTEFFIGLASMFVVATRLALPTPPIEIHIETQRTTFAPKMYSFSLRARTGFSEASASRVCGQLLLYGGVLLLVCLQPLRVSATHHSGPFPAYNAAPEDRRAYRTQ